MAVVGARANAARRCATGRGRAGDDGEDAPSPRPPRTACASVGLLAALCGPVAHAAAPATEATSPALPLLLAALVAAAGVIGFLLGQRSQAADLRRARTALALARQLGDDWQWRSDAQHRLVDLWPPGAAGDAEWRDSASALQQPLWTLFDVAGPGLGLRARLQAQAPIDDLVVLRAVPEGVQRWRLRAQPCFDARGAFEGHVGSARPLDADLRRQADQHALEALLPLWPGPLWLGDSDPLSGGWRVARCNAAAERLGGPAGAAWEEMLAALPAELRSAAERLRPGEAPGRHGPWLLHAMERREPGPPTRLLALLPSGDASEGHAGDAAAFSYTVSHDLRAPIRVVEGFTRIVKEDYGRLLDRVGNDHLDRVLGAAARMNRMIDALLALAQLSSLPLQRQHVDLSQLAGFVVEDLKRQHPERSVEVHIAPGLQAEGDPTLLRLVLENLLGNAWKYSARAARPTVCFEAATDAIAGSAPAEGLRGFVVADNGVGFDMRFADRLFKVFQRLHSASDYPGTGIGLASVQRIVRRHGGEVWAEGEPGRGARFWFTLR